MTRREALHADREDVPDPALGLVLGLLLDLADAPSSLVPSAPFDLLQQRLLGLRGRHAGGLLERPLERVALALERAALAVQRVVAARDRVLAAGQRGASLGELFLRLLGIAGRSRRAGSACPVRASVHERSEHESNRDQRCGTDDFHDRSSPGPGGLP